MSSAPARLSASKYQSEDWAGSITTRRPRNSARAPSRSAGVSRRTSLPSHAGRSAVTLAGSRNSRAVPSALRIAWASGRGRADHVAAADVEQPGDRGGRGEHRRLGPVAGEQGAQPGALGPRGFAGIVQRMGDDRRARLGRPRRAPGHVQGIGVGGFQRRAGLGGGLAQAREGVGAVQARIVADRPAGPGRFPQIGRHAALDEIAELEDAAVHLVAHLQGIAPIDEDRRRVLEDHRRPGRAGEPRGPGQAVVGGGQVLVLVFVLMGDEEAVQALVGHGFADQGRVLAPEGGIGRIIEGLAHGAGFRPPPRRRTRVAQASRRRRRSRRKPRAR